MVNNLKKEKRDAEIAALIKKYRNECSPPQAPVDQPQKSTQALIQNDKLCLSVTETAVALGLSPKSVERAIQRGEIPAKRVGRRLLIIKKELEAWLSSGNTH